MSAAERLAVTLTVPELSELMESAALRALAKHREVANDNGELFTTAEAVAFLKRSPKALRMLVAAGKLVPDVWGRRGKGSTHMFSRRTLKSFAKDR